MLRRLPRHCLARWRRRTLGDHVVLFLFFWNHPWAEHKVVISLLSLFFYLCPIWNKALRLTTVFKLAFLDRILAIYHSDIVTAIGVAPLIIRERAHFFLICVVLISSRSLASRTCFTICMAYRHALSILLRTHVEVEVRVVQLLWVLHFNLGRLEFFTLCSCHLAQALLVGSGLGCVLTR